MSFRWAWIAGLTLAACGETTVPSDGSMVDAGFDAGAPEPCDTPGAVETVPCGMCGTVERFCTAAGTWAYGACGNELECAAGTTRMGTCGNCGTQTQRCTAACMWQDEGACSNEGECAPGTTTRSGTGCPSGQTRQVLCSDACVYEPTSMCIGDPCPTPGAIENVVCGMCGMQQRFCNAMNVWEYDACAGEGVCMPGTTDDVACGMCGTQPARCLDTCQWSVSGACTGEGACTPGAMEYTSMGCSPGETRLMRCDDACGYTIEVEGCSAIRPVDVLFLIDGTASYWTDIQTQRATFGTSCVDPLLGLPNVAVGLAYYGDIGTLPTFVAAVELNMGTSAAIQTSLGTMASIGGADDSTLEALHIVTGGTAQAGATPFSCSAGRVAGGCWRAGAERVVVILTDEAAKGGPDPLSTALWNPWPTGPNWTTVLPRLMTDGTSLFTIVGADVSTTDNAVAQYAEMVTDLGQPATDSMREPAAASIGTPCAALVARIQMIAGL